MTDHVFRVLEVPFKGSGILTPEMSPTFDEALSYLKSLEISAQDWIFLNYSTWAGPVEYVFAFGMRNNEAFGPIECDDDDAEKDYLMAMSEFGLSEADAEKDYLMAMSEFGLSEADAVHFAPFERGFWGSD